MVFAYFSLVLISAGSPGGPLRFDSRQRPHRAEIRAVSVDRSGGAVDFSEDPSSILEMGASQNQCVCHVLEPLSSSIALALPGDACPCADNDAGVVKDHLHSKRVRIRQPGVYSPSQHQVVLGPRRFGAQVREASLEGGDVGLGQLPLSALEDQAAKAAPAWPLSSRPRPFPKASAE